MTREPSANCAALSVILLDGPTDADDDRVDVVAQLAVRARIFLLDGLREVLFRQPLEHFADVADRHAEAFQGLVQAADNLAVVALEAGVVGASVQFALDGRVGQNLHFADEAGDGVNALVEVVLDLVEVAVVVVGDLRGHVALGDAVDVFGRHVDRGHEGIDQLVHAADQRAPAAAKLLGVSARLQLTVLGGLDQGVRLPQQAVHHVDALVEVVLDLVEVAVVVVGDLRGHVALGDAVDVFGRHVDRGHEGIDQLVGPVHDRPELCGNQIRVSARLELALDSRIDEPFRFTDQHGKHLGNAPGDEECKNDSQEHTGKCQCDHRGLGSAHRGSYPSLSAAPQFLAVVSDHTGLGHHQDICFAGLEDAVAILPAGQFVSSELLEDGVGRFVEFRLIVDRFGPGGGTDLRFLQLGLIAVPFLISLGGDEVDCGRSQEQKGLDDPVIQIAAKASPIGNTFGVLGLFGGLTAWCDDFCCGLLDVASELPACAFPCFHGPVLNGTGRCHSRKCLAVVVGSGDRLHHKRPVVLGELI